MTHQSQDQDSRIRYQSQLINCICVNLKEWIRETYRPTYIPCSTKRFARLELEPVATRSLTPQRGLFIQSNVSLFSVPGK